MLTRLRLWLIERLAGTMPIAMNLHIINKSIVGYSDDIGLAKYNLIEFQEKFKHSAVFVNLSKEEGVKWKKPKVKDYLKYYYAS